MNRQVIPSMILSVLIVCFFSIVLYEREKPEAMARSVIGPASASAATSNSQSVDKPAEPPAPVPKNPDAPKPVKENPQQDVKDPAKPETPPAGIADPQTQPSPAAHPEKVKPVAPTEPVAAAPPTTREGPETAPAPVVTQPADPVAVPREKKASAATGSSPRETGHRSLLTTVKEGETLEDVTNRVYGSPEQLDLLWRANRDILPRMNSPLKAGSVLRTPAD